MSVVAPKLFQSSDTGAPTLSGTAGDLVEILSSCLIIRRLFTAVSGGTFVNNTTEARLQGGTGFLFFQGGTVNNDEAYFIYQQPFERLGITFGTPGVQGSAVTLRWEYWNGSAWTQFTPTDGTTGLTANGAVTWSIAALTGWTPNTINSQAGYIIRLRFTAGSWSTNPLVSTTTIGGWTEAYSGTNQRAYQMGGGNQFFLNVNDNGPGAGTAREARIVGFETMSAIGTGTNPFPTVAQSATGLFVRKSATADATTRSWLCLCDDRTVYFYCVSGDSAGAYSGLGFGDFYSFTSSDPYRCFIMARTTENAAVSAASAAAVAQDACTRVDHWSGTTGQAGVPNINVSAGKFLARNYLGAVGAVNVGAIAPHFGPYLTTATSNTQGMIPMGSGWLAYPNTPDGGIVGTQMFLNEGGANIGQGAVTINTGAYLRGRMRGFWCWQHAPNQSGSPTTPTVIPGTGALAGRTFLYVPYVINAFISPFFSGALLFETSDTWETNV